MHATRQITNSAVIESSQNVRSSIS